MPPVINMEQFRKLLDEEHELSKKINKAMIQAFPIGSFVWFEHGKHTRNGEVVGHTHHRDLFIKSQHGKRYRLDAWRIDSVAYPA